MANSSHKNKNQIDFDRSKYQDDTALSNLILGLSDEIDYAQKNRKDVTLKNGEKAGQLGDLFSYRFILERNFDFEADDDLSIAINGNHNQGKVLQIDLASVLIGIKKDLGEFIAKAVVSKAENALELMLRSKLVEVHNGERSFNKERAELVIGQGKGEISKAPLLPLVHSFLNAQKPKWVLNDEQEKFLEKGLNSNYTMLWGPPGCGKTTIIGLLCCSFLSQNKRMLVVSNSNKAVDGALTAILETHSTVSKHDNKNEQTKTIVRPGSDGITQEFKENWGHEALIDELVKKAAQDLESEKRELLSEKGQIHPLLRKVEAELHDYKSLTKAQSNLECEKQNRTSAISGQKKFNEQISKATRSLRNLHAEYESAPEEKSIKTRLGFSRLKEVIEKELLSTHEELKKLEGELKELNEIEALCQHSIPALKDEINTLQDAVQQHRPEKLLVTKKDEITTRLNEIESRLSEIEKSLTSLKEEILSKADVIGTTVHKSFIDPIISSSEFDVVIIDEASMLILPMSYWAAGLAKKQVIVVGDFKQIPSITKDSKSELVQEWVAKSPFDKCDIRSSVKKNQYPDYLVALKEQNRMHEEISDLISNTFYGSMLKTGTRVKSRKAVALIPGQKTDKRITLIDTKDLGGWSSPPFSGSGRFNPTHVALAVSLIDKMIADGQITASSTSAIKEVGYVTPYAGQAELFSKAIQGKRNDYMHESSVGTAHKFQGSERNTIIFDYVLSEARSRSNPFIDSETGEDQPACLLNVALSRAKEKLVIIYNSQEFQAKNSTRWMTDFFSTLAKSAEHLNASEVIDGSSLLGEVKGIAQGRSFTVEEPNTLHNEMSFYKAVRADIRGAQKSVVIFSAFATPDNFSRWLDDIFTLLKKNVKIRIVTKTIKLQPGSEGSGDQLRSMISACRKAGVAIDLRAATHEKTVVIDNKIVWHGSLNMLSQNQSKTTESMTRTVSKDFAQLMLKQLSRHDIKQKDQSSQQLPVCPTCSHPTSLFQNWQGQNTLVCENGCGYIAGDWSNGRAFSLLAKGVPIGRIIHDKCPECKKGSVKLQERFGKYFAKCENNRQKSDVKCSFSEDVSISSIPNYAPFPEAMAKDVNDLQRLVNSSQSMNVGISSTNKKVKKARQLSKPKVGNSEMKRNTIDQANHVKSPPTTTKKKRVKNAKELDSLLAQFK